MKQKHIFPAILIGLIVALALVIIDVAGCADWREHRGSLAPDTVIRSFNQERYRYEDSLIQAHNAILLDSIRILYSQQASIDTKLYQFYNYNTYKYESNINRIQHASAEDIMRQWAERYDR